MTKIDLGCEKRCCWDGDCLGGWQLFKIPRVSSCFFSPGGYKIVSLVLRWMKKYRQFNFPQVVGSYDAEKKMSLEVHFLGKWSNRKLKADTGHWANWGMGSLNRPFCLPQSGGGRGVIETQFAPHFCERERKGVFWSTALWAYCKCEIRFSFWSIRFWAIEEGLSLFFFFLPRLFGYNSSFLPPSASAAQKQTFRHPPASSFSRGKRPDFIHTHSRVFAQQVTAAMPFPFERTRNSFHFFTNTLFLSFFYRRQ